MTELRSAAGIYAALQHVATAGGRQSLEEHHPCAALGQVIGRGGAVDAGVDDGDVRAHDLETTACARPMRQMGYARRHHG